MTYIYRLDHVQDPCTMLRQGNGLVHPSWFQLSNRQYNIQNVSPSVLPSYPPLQLATYKRCEDLGTV